MDEKTLSALTELASKFGTTAEYLWAVLIKQAPVTAIADAAMTLFFAIVCYSWLSYVKRKTTPSQHIENSERLYAEWESDEAVMFSWASVVALFCILLISVIIYLPGIITAIINPEYWALNQILR